MARIDLSTYLADDTLTLDGVPSAKHPQNADGTGGKSYIVPSLSGEDGLRLQRLLTLDADADNPDADTLEVMTQFLTGPDGRQQTMREKLLGAALPEMLADGVTNNTIEALMGVITTQASSGTEMARMFVERAGVGEAEPPNRAARRAAKKQPASPRKAGSRSNATSGASRTPRNRTSTSASSTGVPAPSKPAKTA